MNKYRKLAKNTILIAIGNFSTKILSFIFIPLYTYILTTSEYGVIDLIFTITTLILPIFTLLVNEAVLRFSLDKESNPSKIYKIGLNVTINGIIIFLLISFAATFFIDKYLILLFVMYYLSNTFLQFYIHFLKGLNRTGFYSIISIFNSIFIISLNLVFLLIFKWGIYGYITAYAISNFLTVFIILILKTKFLRVEKTELDKNLKKEMLKYSLPMIPNSLSWWISDSSDKILLTILLGTATTGIYAIAYKIPSLLTIFTAIFISAWQLSAVDDFGSEKTRLFYTEVLSFYVSLLFILTTLIISSIKYVGIILFSNDFYSAWKITPILLLAFVFNTMAAFYGTIYTSSKKSKMLLYSTLSGAIINIFLNLMLIPILGAIGAAIATCLSYLIILSIRIVHSKKIMRLSLNLTKLIILILLVIIQIIIISVDREFSFLYSLIITVLILGIEHKNIKYFIINLFNFLRKKMNSNN